MSERGKNECSKDHKNTQPQAHNSKQMIKEKLMMEKLLHTDDGRGWFGIQGFYWKKCMCILWLSLHFNVAAKTLFSLMLFILCLFNMSTMANTSSAYQKSMKYETNETAIPR